MCVWQRHVRPSSAPARVMRRNLKWPIFCILLPETIAKRLPFTKHVFPGIQHHPRDLKHQRLDVEERNPLSITFFLHYITLGRSRCRQNGPVPVIKHIISPNKPSIALARRSVSPRNRHFNNLNQRNTRRHGTNDCRVAGMGGLTCLLV